MGAEFPVKDVQTAIEFHQRSVEASLATVARLRNMLRGRCDHVKTEPYEWEHDNGYGKQTMIKGKRCVYCRATKPWAPHGAWIEEL